MRDVAEDEKNVIQSRAAKNVFTRTVKKAELDLGEDTEKRYRKKEDE